MIKFKAYTLVEVLLCFSVLAILMLFTMPFGSSLYQKNQVKVVADEIKSAVRYARINALTRGENMLLTPLQGSQDWSEGMLLFIDNAQHKYTKVDKLIYEWHCLSPGVHVHWNGFQSTQYLLFSSDISQSATNGFFLITSGSKHASKLIVNKIGRTKLV